MPTKSVALTLNEAFCCSTATSDEIITTPSDNDEEKKSKELVKVTRPTRDILYEIASDLIEKIQESLQSPTDKNNFARLVSEN